jgi:trigger factor
MQISVEQISELGRKMTVSIPEETIQEKVSVRLKSLKNNLKIDGFRPGKIPQSLIKKRYGAQAKHEIRTDMIQSSYYEALQQETLKPVDMPKIEPIEQDEGLSYTAEFEIYPNVSLTGLADIEVKRPIVTIEIADFEAILQRIREYKTQWQTVERGAENQDQLTINFLGTCEGENFTNTQDFKVRIGHNQMLPGFEDQLLTLKTGDTKQFELSFPENYAGNAVLKGKLAHFEVEVIKIEQPFIPEIDADFIKDYGIENGDKETFYAKVKLNMEQDLNNAIASKLKHAVLNALYTHIKITLPESLIEQEIKALIQSSLATAKQENRPVDPSSLTPDIFEEQAKRSISLGLIMTEIIQQNNISLDHRQLDTMINEIAQNYPKPDEVIKDYYEQKNETQLNNMKQLVLENQAIEWLTQKMIITDKIETFNELMTHVHQ